MLISLSDYCGMGIKLIRGIKGYYVWKRLKNKLSISQNDMLVIVKKDCEELDIFSDNIDKYKEYHGFRKVILCTRFSERKNEKINELESSGIDKVEFISKIGFNNLLIFYSLNNLNLPITLLSFDEPKGRNILCYLNASNVTRSELFKVGVLGML